VILFLVTAYLFTAFVGVLLEKVKVPWIFASLILGLGLASFNPFSDVMSSDVFAFLTNMGMWFLLFVIGFEINLKEIRTQKEFIVKTTLFLIFLETVGGSFFVHFIFGTPWLIAIVVAMSFATVGETVLLPILEEFSLVRTRVGQIILGCAIFDDIFEVALIFATILLTGVTRDGDFNVAAALASLALLFIMTVVLLKSGKINKRLEFPDGEFAFLLSILVLFLFIAVGQLALSEASSVGALFSGIAIGNFLPKEGKDRTRLAVRSIGFALFGPLFLVSVGAKVSIAYLSMFPYLVFAKVALTKGIKIAGSYLIGRKKIGVIKSLILGSCLSVKFSTSIIVFTILLDKGLIGIPLYSVLISSKVVYKFIVPLVLRSLVPKANLIRIE
jgi:Ca2+-transporting ATPase